ncbi:MAG: hypothetical protein OXI15_23255 [Chromatiales bacterium]|nr:hypothetical protein [Chromatiales bacterium]
MAVKDVTKNSVESALEEFRRTTLEAMLDEYGGGPATKWYVQVDSRLYDQKLVVRAAHRLQGLGDLYPRGPGSFNADQARNLLKRLGYRVVSRVSPTNENLGGPSATEPLARWLIGAAQQVPPATLTYEETASRLERECGFSRIVPASRLGKTVAALQYAIHERDPSAPLLNILLVRRDTGWPASDAQEFLASLFPGEPRLGEADADAKYPEIWARHVRRATEEAHRYTGWIDLYTKIFGTYDPDPFYAPRTRIGGGGGEGPNHRALREWVKEHPARVDKHLRDVDTETEVPLLSGDRVDVVYRTEGEVVAIEVKSRDSNWPDLQRGIYQCVKYRAVMDAQETETSGRRVRTLLVTETHLPADLERAAKRLDVPHLRVAPVDR